MEVIYCGISGKEMLINQSVLKACEARRKSVEKAVAKAWQEVMIIYLEILWKVVLTR